MDKIRDLESKVSQSKEQAFNAEKLREQQAIEYENKLEGLKQKLLAKLADNTANGLTNSLDAAGGSSQQFTELLALCRSDLGEILEKLRQKFADDTSVEDQLRQELLS